jgi:hypothetical protein
VTRRRGGVAPPVGPRGSERLPYAKLHLFCEGRNTEVDWIRSLQPGVGAHGLRFGDRLGGLGPASRVVERAVAARLDLDRRRKGRPETAGDEVWAVFDRDGHDLSSALHRARDAGVGIVFSNPCFELWPLLHLRDGGGPAEARELQAQLQEAHPRYRHDAGAEVHWRRLPDAEAAIARALVLHARTDDETTWAAGAGDRDHPRGAFANPSTTAWLFHWRCTDPVGLRARLGGPGPVAGARPLPRADDLIACLAEPFRSAVRRAREFYPPAGPSGSTGASGGASPRAPRVR